ncbi:DUF4783 domain-containing protein [Terrimonas rubra]|jgi:hypothetical protein|uniref:DUF4783 domain-containing protein n=1 Tax=Terrimonas rubra TaxID=1035890 RepID=A0ABW6A0N8_9BACT
MKTIYTPLLALFSFVMLTAFEQKSNIDSVISSLKTGNATELSKYSDENLLLTLPDKSDSYSKSQAQQILRDFFGTNGVKGFELKHKGNSPGGQYCIGTLQTKSGNYRTHVFMQTKSGKESLKEIRFQFIE